MLQNRKGEYREMDTLCVLDFYVDESCQRLGLGLKLFQALLQVGSIDLRVASD